VDFSAPVTLVSQGCTQPRSDRVRCLVSQLDPGGSRILDVVLTGLPAAPGSLQIDALVTSSADNDADPDNNTDALTIGLRTGIDLNVSVDNGRDQMAPGETIQYAVVVENYGSVAASDAVVDVELSPELLDVEWTCEAEGGAICAPFGLDALTDTVSLPWIRVWIPMSHARSRLLPWPSPRRRRMTSTRSTIWRWTRMASVR
jgi:uncharacterized repeat protein (TIGR01451 family)